MIYQKSDTYVCDVCDTTFPGRPDKCPACKRIVRKLVPRVAIVKNAEPEQVEPYLPGNYTVSVVADRVVVSGVDRAGWTLDGYVIPRLGSGLIVAKEIA